jgi:hypothetical protein
MNEQQRAAVRQALTWMDEIHPGNMTPMAEDAWDKSRAALRQLLEQPADHCEQHLDMVDHGDELTIAYLDGVHTGKQIAKREWVGLTEEELYAVRVPMSPEEIARAIEAKLKEKNT